MKGLVQLETAAGVWMLVAIQTTGWISAFAAVAALAFATLGLLSLFVPPRVRARNDDVVKHTGGPKAGI